MNKIITIFIYTIGLILAGMMAYKMNTLIIEFGIFWIIFVNLCLLLLFIIYIYQAVGDIKEDWLV